MAAATTIAAMALVAATELAGKDAARTARKEGFAVGIAFVADVHFGCSGQMWSSDFGGPFILIQVRLHF